MATLLTTVIAASPQAAMAWPKKVVPVIELPPPPPPPVLPPIDLAGKVLEYAGAYRTYMARAAAISPSFSDGDSVASALRTGETWAPGGLVRGAVAYGAVAALQAPNFVSELRKFAGDAQQRVQIADYLRTDPRYILSFQGVDDAAALVVSAVGDDGLRLAKTGLAIKQAAYDIQKSPWSKVSIPNKAVRLAQSKASEEAEMSPGDIEDIAKLRIQALGGAGMSPLVLTTTPAAQAPYSQLVVRSMALAALAALGEAGDDKVDQLTPVLDEASSQPCLGTARRNLYQCLAVAGPHYEDVFCLGQHAMVDTGVCLVKASGALLPAELTPAPLATAISDSARPYLKTASKGKGKGKSRSRRQAKAGSTPPAA